MPRGRTAPTPIVAEPAEKPAADIVVDRSKLTIGDLLIFAELGAKASDPDQANAAMMKVLPVVDRLVVGGVSHRPVTELPQIMQAVAAQLNEAADPNR